MCRGYCGEERTQQTPSHRSQLRHRIGRALKVNQELPHIGPRESVVSSRHPRRDVSRVSGPLEATRTIRGMLVLSTYRLPISLQGNITSQNSSQIVLFYPTCFVSCTIGSLEGSLGPSVP